MNIYVGNLASDVGEDDVRGVFEAFGKVQSVNIITDRSTGESKGFGFVEMPSADEGRAAIEEADGTDLKGLKIKVNEAHPRPASGGGGRDRGRSGGHGGPRERRGGGGGGGRGRDNRRGGDRGGRSRY